MIISHKYKLIFVHIYKNGGTFVGQLLKNLDKNIVRTNNHITAKEAQKQFPDIWDKYTKICIVRNSWDWEISLLFFMKRDTTHHQHNIVKDMSVSQYVKWRKTDLHQQLKFILDDKCNCLIDNILRFDNLTENLKDFFKEKYDLDITNYLPTEKLNKSGNRNDDYRKYYDDDDKKLVEKMHFPDINFFDFTF